MLDRRLEAALYKINLLLSCANEKYYEDKPVEVGLKREIIPAVRAVFAIFDDAPRPPPAFTLNDKNHQQCELLHTPVPKVECTPSTKEEERPEAGRCPAMNWLQLLLWRLFLWGRKAPRSQADPSRKRKEFSKLLACRR
jgi:hypothetical protein